MSETDKAYVAGVIDCKGCIQVSIIKEHSMPRLAVVSGSSRLISSLLAAIGDGNDRPKQSRLVWSGNRACDLLKDIIPYLREKRSQAQLVIDEFSNGPTRDHVAGREIDSELKKLRRECLLN